MPAYTIEKDFHLSYSHALRDLPEDHPCSRVHGHNAVVRIVLGDDDVNHVGFVTDYRDLDVIKEWLDEQFDHQHLNDRVHFNPTAEYLAQFVYAYVRTRFPQVVKVGWSETPRTWAWFHGFEGEWRPEPTTEEA